MCRVAASGHPLSTSLSRGTEPTFQPIGAHHAVGDAGASHTLSCVLGPLRGVILPRESRRLPGPNRAARSSKVGERYHLVCTHIVCGLRLVKRGAGLGGAGRVATRRARCKGGLRGRAGASRCSSGSGRGHSCQSAHRRLTQCGRAVQRALRGAPSSAARYRGGKRSTACARAAPPARVGDPRGPHGTAPPPRPSGPASRASPRGWRWW